MTIEERKLALYCLKASSDYHSEVCEECTKYPNCDHMGHDDVTETIIKALEQEPKAEQFAEWVATEIFDEYWEYNKDAFEELACRKLAKLGIVRAIGDEWELVEQESEEING